MATRVIEASPSPPPSTLCEGRFQILHLIGKGAFSQVWKALDTRSGSHVAVKFEDYEDEEQALQLEDEARLLKECICKPSQPRGFPEVIEFGDIGHFCFMVCDLLGPSLGDLLESSSNPLGAVVGHFEPPVVASLAVQMLSRLAWLHSKGVLHRDIKPENFVIGLGAKAHLLHLVDFGLSGRFVRQGVHIPFREGVSIKGTIRYASRNALRRHESSRRDDLESLGYVLVMLAKGKLPWTGQAAKDEADMARIVLRSKEKSKPKDLCSGLPGAFAEFLEASRAMGFSQTPDYTRLTEKFRRMVAKDLDTAAAYPWLRPRDRKQQEEFQHDLRKETAAVESWDDFPPQLELEASGPGGSVGGGGGRWADGWALCGLPPLFSQCMTTSKPSSGIDSDEESIGHSSDNNSSPDSGSETSSTT